MPTYYIKSSGSEWTATQVRRGVGEEGRFCRDKGDGGDTRRLGRGWRSGRSGSPPDGPPSHRPPNTHFQADEGADATATGESLAAVVAELTNNGAKGHSLSEVVPGKSAVLTTA